MTFKRSCRTCGWSGDYRSEPMADYAKRQHSCEKALRKAEALTRAQRREAAIDRTPKPCLHPIAQHVHGTHACYVLDRCRCDACSTANREYENRRAKLHAYGRFDTFVDAEPVRQHVRWLMDQGMGLKRIVAVSDVTQGMLWKLMYGKRRPDGTQIPSRRVLRTTADRVLAVELDLADGARVCARGPQRRLQALVAIGYSLSYLAERLGVARANFTTLIEHQDYVTRATADAVDELFRELCMTPRIGTDQRSRISISRARNHAAAKGWPPPLAWDDIDNDAAPATSSSSRQRDDVDELAVDWAIAGAEVALNIGERREAVRRLATGNEPLSDREIADRLRTTDRTVLRIRQELGIKAAIPRTNVPSTQTA